MKLAVEINYFDTFFILFIRSAYEVSSYGLICEEFCLSLTQNEFNRFCLMKSQPPPPKKKMELIANDIEMHI